MTCFRTTPESFFPFFLTPSIVASSVLDDQSLRQLYYPSTTASSNPSFTNTFTSVIFTRFLATRRKLTGSAHNAENSPFRQVWRDTGVAEYTLGSCYLLASSFSLIPLELVFVTRLSRVFCYLASGFFTEEKKHIPFLSDHYSVYSLLSTVLFLCWVCIYFVLALKGLGLLCVSLVP